MTFYEATEALAQKIIANGK